MCQQRGNATGEGEFVIDLRQEQRLDTEPVAGQKQAVVAKVVQPEREHAAKLRDAIGSPLVVGRHHHFGIAMRLEAMPQPGEFVA